MNEDIKKLINFTVEIEKMKSIERRTKIIDINRRENDAEHTFSIATMAIYFHWLVPNTNLNKTIQMLLVHDLVEIYAGDTFAYDTKANENKKIREELAADKLYSLLPTEIGNYMRNLWEEFDENKTPEAKFANAMDRLQPVINNIKNNGGTWLEYDVNISQLEKRLQPVKDFNNEIYDYVMSEALKYLKNGEQ